MKNGLLRISALHYITRYGWDALHKLTVCGTKVLRMGCLLCCFLVLFRLMFSTDTHHTKIYLISTLQRDVLTERIVTRTLAKLFGQIIEREYLVSIILL